MTQPSSERQALQQRLYALLVLCAAMMPAGCGFIILAFAASGIARVIAAVGVLLASAVLVLLGLRLLRTYRQLNG